MSTKDELLESAGETFEYANLYVQQQLRLFKLKSAKQSAKSISSLITLGVIAFLSTMVILMLTLAIGFWLGSLWQSNALAFFAITGIYTLLTIGVYLLRVKLITNPILKFILKSFWD